MKTKEQRYNELYSSGLVDGIKNYLLIEMILAKITMF